MIQFAEKEYATLLLLIPFLLLLYAYSWNRKKTALSKLVSPQLQHLISPYFSHPKFWLKLILVFLVFTLLVVVLMRPQGDPRNQIIKKQGRDLVFVIDVSKSMLAEDLQPNRLEKAKQMVSDVLSILEGDRVGLLVFAGTTAIKSPLTLDYNYFRNVLNRISPQDISRGGTNIGDAIRIVSERLFYDQSNKFRDVILITDGEDHRSFPIEAAEEAAKKGIRIHTIGLGDPDGANIPLRTGNNYSLLKYDNQVVRSALDENTLKKIAALTKGIFVPVRTDLIELERLYKDYIAPSGKREIESKESRIWSELFQFFLGVAIILLILESLLGEKKIVFKKNLN
ncbi:MAG: VWA domain-containing protein [Proteobacteria bacterium]|nr:VWA domain-containing protein [Pseudomonadota bacterium]